jgi:acyl phosphate:glycerol-3-phosphate acyltransferase
VTSILVLILASYVVGATPVSWWAGKWIGGVDLRSEGSGNLGATNVYRVLGARVAVPVLLLDVLKGWTPAALFPGFVAGQDPRWALAFGGAAIVGHVFSFWVGFRGGKGVATSAGVFLALAPWATLAALVVWVSALRLSGYVSLASILAALVLPLLLLVLPHEGGWLLFSFTVGLATFVIWAHRTNLDRLMKGEENRIGQGRRNPAGME